MRFSADRARYESALARAHKALYQAQESAEAMGDDGAAEDLRSLLRHVGVLAESSLRGKVRKPIPGQTRLV